MAHKFTVILVRPDWCADNYGTDVMICYVEVDDYDAKKAVEQAKRELWEQDNSGPDGQQQSDIGAPDDYHCVAAFVGWQSSCYGD